MASKFKAIEQGDIFRKTEKFESLWIVTRILDLYGYPPHVHLKPVNDERHPLTYATAALNNPHLFTRVSH